jgi:hypothetical protein
VISELKYYTVIITAQLLKLVKLYGCSFITGTNKITDLTTQFTLVLMDSTYSITQFRAVKGVTDKSVITYNMTKVPKVWYMFSARIV